MEHSSVILRTVEAVYLTFLAISIVIANICVLYVYLFRASSVQTSNKYRSLIVNLAFCDLAVGLLQIPFWLLIRFGKNMR